MTLNITALVEGFHDRSFLAGWLLRRGWTDPGLREGLARKAVVNPVTGERVSPGRFGFLGPGDNPSFIEIVPAGGFRSLVDSLKSLVKRATPPDPDEILVVVDADGSGSAIAARRDAIRSALTRASTSIDDTNGTWAVQRGVRVRLIVWQAGACEQQGLPVSEDLERLVCAAIGDAHPSRAAAVSAWLENRPERPDEHTAKPHSWSHMAGWYADEGCDQFWRALWRQEPIRIALENRLKASGAEAVIESIERPTI